jgi:sensor histidine kinase YesM
VTARLESTGSARALVIVVHDTGAGVGQVALRAGRKAGVGLSNVERRLACQYGDAASMSIDSASGAGTTVTITMPAEHKAEPIIRSARSAS